MNRPLRFALLPFLLCLAALLPASGKKEAETPASPQNVAEQSTFVQASGRVRLVGGGLLPSLVLSNPETEWYIDRDDESLLKDLQHQEVTVEGYETVMQLYFANGQYAGERRILRGIRIISID